MPGIPNIWTEEIGTADCDLDDQCLAVILLSGEPVNKATDADYRR